jgi:hypothetical protein
VLNDKYAREGHRIMFSYVNVARRDGEENAIVARLELPEWAAQDEKSLDQVVGALCADCELTGVPYVLARGHELAVVTSAERVEFESMLEQQMIRYGLSPQLSAKAIGKRLTAAHGRRPGHARPSER